MCHLRTKGLKFSNYSNIYQVYKDLEGVKKVSLTVKETKKYQHSKTRVISIYGDSYNWQSNYFNQLSALKLVDNSNLLVIDSKNIVNRFCKFFNIKYSTMGKFNVVSFRKTLKNIAVASCVEFSSLFDLFVIDSYNHGVPVVVGNNNMFFKHTELEKMVIVKSDDDINEISEKLSYCLNNSKKIIEIYKKIKRKYDQECKKMIKIREIRYNDTEQ